MPVTSTEEYSKKGAGLTYLIDSQHKRRNVLHLKEHAGVLRQAGIL